MKNNNDFQNYYLEDLCDNKKLHVIAYTSDCILYKEIANNKAHFLYTTSPDNLDNGMRFDFSLLSECNDNANGQFTQILNDLKMTLEVMETDSDYFNIIISKY